MQKCIQLKYDLSNKPPRYVFFYLKIIKLVFLNYCIHCLNTLLVILMWADSWIQIYLQNPLQ